MATFDPAAGCRYHSGRQHVRRRRRYGRYDPGLPARLAQERTSIRSRPGPWLQRDDRCGCRHDREQSFCRDLRQPARPGQRHPHGYAGSDTFTITTLVDGTAPQIYDNVITITDFRAGAGGDKLDVYGSGRWTGITPFSDGQYRVIQRGADTVFQYDANGRSVADGYRDLVILKNVDKNALVLENTMGWRIDGSTKGELIEGSPGDDTLSGGMLADTIHGGAGRDTASYDGKASEYRITHDLAGWHVTDQRSGGDGADTLQGVERLAFADAAVALDLDGIAAQAYRLYRAAFDREPDAGGLGFWIARLDAGLPLQDAANGFINSSEFSDLYRNAAGNGDIVMRLYHNILHRDPDPVGYQFWVDVLDNKQASLQAVLASFSESKENVEAVAELIANGIVYTPYGG
jgi:hypothetical protein